MPASPARWNSRRVGHVSNSPINSLSIAPIASDVHPRRIPERRFCRRSPNSRGPAVGATSPIHRLRRWVKPSCSNFALDGQTPPGQGFAEVSPDPILSPDRRVPRSRRGRPLPESTRLFIPQLRLGLLASTALPAAGADNGAPHDGQPLDRVSTRRRSWRPTLTRGGPRSAPTTCSRQAARCFTPICRGSSTPRRPRSSASSPASPARFDDYLDTERRSGRRYLRNSGRVQWLVSFAPIAPAELRAFAPGVASPAELSDELLTELAYGLTVTLNAYADTGYESFNLPMYGAPPGTTGYPLNLRIACRSDLKPFYRSDSTFLDRLYWEGAVDLAPEDVAERIRRPPARPTAVRERTSVCVHAAGVTHLAMLPPALTASRRALGSRMTASTGKPRHASGASSGRRHTLLIVKASTRYRPWTGS